MAKQWVCKKCGGEEFDTEIYYQPTQISLYAKRKGYVKDEIMDELEIEICCSDCRDFVMAEDISEIADYREVE